MFHRFLQSVFICDMFFCCDANIRTGYQNLQYGYRLDGEMIDSFAEHSILDCVKECLRTTRCLSLSYYGGANYCEINYENKRTASGRYIKSLGWVYSQREDWPMVKYLLVNYLQILILWGIILTRKFEFAFEWYLITFIFRKYDIMCIRVNIWLLK